MNFGSSAVVNLEMIWGTGFERNGRSMSGIKNGPRQKLRAAQLPLPLVLQPTAPRHENTNSYKTTETKKGNKPI
jgi:hypothetical protein